MEKKMEKKMEESFRLHTSIHTIEENLSKIARSLGCKRQELIVMLDSIMPDPYMSALHNFEKLIDAYHITGDKIYILRRRNHDNNNVSDHFYGCRIYQTRSESPIQFALIRLSTDARMFLVMKNEEVKRLYKRARAYCGHVVKPIKKPIIDEDAFRLVVKETLGFIQILKKHKEYDIRATRGLMLHGPPGNGKTMLCRWLINEFTRQELTTNSVTSTQIRQAQANDSLAELFGNRNLIVCDDIDISFFDRNGANGELACSLLASLDGVTKAQRGAIRVFTSNESVEDMDPAFRRPGRIDKAIEIPLPNDGLKLQFIQTWNTELLKNIKAENIQSACKGMSFAEMDEVQRAMIVNWLESKQWDLDLAIEQTRNRLSDLPQHRESVGFGADEE